MFFTRLTPCTTTWFPFGNTRMTSRLPLSSPRITRTRSPFRILIFIWSLLSLTTAEPMKHHVSFFAQFACQTKIRFHGVDTVIIQNNWALSSKQMVDHQVGIANSAHDNSLDDFALLNRRLRGRGLDSGDDNVTNTGVTATVPPTTWMTSNSCPVLSATTKRLSFESCLSSSSSTTSAVSSQALRPRLLQQQGFLLQWSLLADDTFLTQLNLDNFRSSRSRSLRRDVIQQRPIANIAAEFVIST